MKEKWENPKVLALGVNSTREDGISTMDITGPGTPPGGNWTRVRCRECGMVFESEVGFNDPNAHRSNCTNPNVDNAEYLYS